MEYKEVLDKIIHGVKIVEKMRDDGINPKFLVKLMTKAMRYRGLYELMVMWDEEEDEAFKDEVLVSMIEDVHEIRHKPKK